MSFQPSFHPAFETDSSTGMTSLGATLDDKKGRRWHDKKRLFGITLSFQRVTYIFPGSQYWRRATQPHQERF
ncbi:hypothetical protein HET73_03485 [Wolbachia endosymbiont of Atemnus politus]|uniref:hypothetical protein n=1 Tax=Wolbachia endosymbiont of Atemnus politus TaxID=2682840 RepID=UPI001572871F|nr:hypothetical protein [Wolbachia endosymbiont of Atemnus politus]NSM56573.1 hypothetical protein [Wolbachia endosymbiont of Atemnus politus]